MEGGGSNRKERGFEVKRWKTIENMGGGDRRRGREREKENDKERKPRRLAK